MIAEISTIFADLDEDLILSMLAGCEKVTLDIIELLNEEFDYTIIKMSELVSMYDQWKGKKRSSQENEQLIVQQNKDSILFNDTSLSFSITLPNCDEQSNFQSVYIMKHFGCYIIKVFEKELVKDFIILTVSYVFDYSLLVSGIFEELYWGFEIDAITNELEEALLQLVLVIDESLVSTIESMTSFFAKFGMTAESLQLKNLVKIIEKDCSDALESHSKLSIGRLHMTLTQFISDASVSLMSLPATFVDAVVNFEIIKLKISNLSNMNELLTRLKIVIPSYIKEANILEDSVEFKRLKNVLDSLESGQQISGTILSKLKPGDIESFSYTNDKSCSARPIVEDNDALFGGQRLINQVSTLNEKLLLDTIRIGSGLKGFSINESNFEKSANIIAQLLKSGLTYVFSANTLLGSLAMTRAYIDLRKELPKNVLKRKHDAARVIRRHKREGGGNLIFKINSNFEMVLKLLREYHGIECWITDDVEKAWHVMYAGGQLWTLELWNEEELIAGDIAHPIIENNSFISVYIATRFSNKQFSKLQPGFILALLSMKFLKSINVSFWDLGGVDSNPLMAYKYEIASTNLRTIFLNDFNIVRKQLINKKEEERTDDSTIFFFDYTVINDVQPEDVK